MIQPQLIPSLLSAIIHGGAVAAVAWYNMGESNDVRQAPALSYDIVFQSPKVEEAAPLPTPPALPKASPTRQKQRISPNPKAMTQSNRAKAMNLPASNPCSLPQGPTRKAVYSSPTLNNQMPNYPLIARINEHQGCVQIKVVLTKSGNISSISFYKESEHFELNEVAIDAVKGWHFLPALEDGEPIQSESIITFHFNLTDVELGAE